MVTRGHLATAALVAVAVLVWVAGADRADLGRLTDLGLVSIVPATTWVALGVSALAFVVALRTRRFSVPFAALALFSMLVVLYATPAALEGAPRLEASYRHLGIVDQISATGAVDRSVDAYFSWPGFFGAAGFLQDVSGLPSLIPVAALAPLVAAVAYLPPLLLIMRSLVSDPRQQWLGVGAFSALNWVGQDYLAPQTFGFWLFLCVIGVLLAVTEPGRGEAGRVQARWLGWWRRRFPHDTAGESAAVRVPVTRRQLVGVLALVVLASATIVASHQLTPYMLILALGLLWVVGRIRQWWLPVFTALLAGWWLLVPAWPYTSGHLPDLLLRGQAADDGTKETLGQRIVNGNPDHLVVVAVRLAESGAVWLAALGGAWVLWRRGHRVAAPAVLVGGPLLLVPLQTYGGEMMLRAYLFSLPFAAVLIAGLLLGLTTGPWARGAVLWAVVSVAMATTLLTRYGNERGESFRPAEVDAFEWVYAQDEPNTAVVALTDNTPWRFRHYSDWAHEAVMSAEPGVPWERDPTVNDVIARIVDSTANTVYVVYTDSQAAMAELSGNTDPGTVQALLESLTSDPRFTVVHRTDHATVLRWEGGHFS